MSFPVRLFIVVKIKSVHTDSIAFLNTGFLKFFQNTALFQEFLEESKSFFRIQICISKHFFNLWTFYNKDGRIICILIYCIRKVLTHQHILREEFLFKNDWFLLTVVKKFFYMK